MDIKMTTPINEVRQYLGQCEARIDLNVFRELAYCGEEGVNIVRHQHNNDWKDDTSCLRSSTGYIVIKDGKPVKIADFKAVKAEGEPGSESGRAFANEQTQEHPTGWALVYVAGMHYASYVAGKGYDVLDSAELHARRSLEKRLKSLTR